MGKKIGIRNPKGLEKIIREKKDKSEDFKAMALKLVHKFGSVKEVGQLLDLSETTIFKWQKSWNKSSEGLKSKRGQGGGRKEQLTKKQKDKLIFLLQERNSWTTQEIKELIKNNFEIEYSDWHICRLARKLGMNLAKPFQSDCRKPLNAEELLDAQIKLTFELLKEKGITKIAIGMLDETAPQTTANTVRMWSFGKPLLVKNTDKIKSNTAGFYALEGKSVVMSMKNGKAEEVCRMLEIIRAENIEYEVIIVILDNAPTHRSQMVKEKAEELNIYFIYLPPYSPQLNPIEYIWKSLKRVISTTFIESPEFMNSLINVTFLKLSNSLSFAHSWISKFLPNFLLLSG